MKSIEEELTAPFGALNKALDRIEKTFVKFVHGMNAQQQEMAIRYLQERAASTMDAMMRAKSKAQPFSFAKASESKTDFSSPTLTNGQDTARAIRQQNEVEAGVVTTSRPLGRLAKDAQGVSPEDTGRMIVGAPIVSPIVPNLDAGTGFINPRNAKGDLI